MTTWTPGVVPTFAALLGGDLPVAVTAFNGIRAGPEDPLAALDVASPDALQRMLSAPGELGLWQALVRGDLRIEGDLYAVLALREQAAARPRHINLVPSPAVPEEGVG